MRSASIVNLCGYQEAPIGKIATWNELIDKSIRSVGGYWPPLAGVARLLEELGEVAVELRREPRIQNKLAEELADVFFISTCVANQYLADLGAAYADAVLDDSLVIKTAVEPAPIVFLDLLCSASSLARTVNLYEGSKPLKPDEHVTRIGQAVARLHRALAELASGMCVRLADEVRAACERKSNRDRGRFKISFDAALCPARMTPFCAWRDSGERPPGSNRIARDHLIALRRSWAVSSAFRRMKTSAVLLSTFRDDLLGAPSPTWPQE